MSENLHKHSRGAHTHTCMYKYMYMYIMRRKHGVKDLIHCSEVSIMHEATSVDSDVTAASVLTCSFS